MTKVFQGRPSGDCFIQMHSDIRAAAAALGCNGKILSDHKIQVTQCSPDEMNAFFVEGASLESVLANQICATDVSLSSLVSAGQRNLCNLNLSLGGGGVTGNGGGSSAGMVPPSSSALISSSIPFSTAIFPLTPTDLSPLSGAAAALGSCSTSSSSSHQMTSLPSLPPLPHLNQNHLNLVTPPSSPPKASLNLAQPVSIGMKGHLIISISLPLSLTIIDSL